MQQCFEIIGSGSYLPKRAVSAADVDQLAGLEPGWTEKNSKVLTRYQCASPETLATMAVESSNFALQRANLSISEIGLIIDCSTSRHRPIPCNAAHIQAALGASNSGIPAFDIQSTCLGFIVAMNVANGFFASGQYERILIVCSEAALAGANWNEPESATLIGDGSAAFILQKANRGDCFLRHETFSEHLECCKVEGGAHHLPPFEWTEQNSSKYRFHMDGPTVFRVAMQHLPNLVDSIVEESKLDRGKLHVVPHQASPKANRAVGHLLNFDRSRFHGEMREHGNLAAAGIPFVLDQCIRNSKVERGDKIMLLGTSAGYSQASMIFEL